MINVFRYFQPVPDPERHEWRFTTAYEFAPGYGDGIGVPKLEELDGFDCPLDVVTEVCVEMLTVDDVEPAQSDVDLCVVDNWYSCHEATIDHPATNGWVQARSCDAEACSVWSNPIAVSEPVFETALWLGVCVCFLINAIVHRRKR